MDDNNRGFDNILLVNEEECQGRPSDIPFEIDQESARKQTVPKNEESASFISNL